MESPVKVLGIQWNPGRDVMFVKPTEFDLSIVPTKRELLSQLSKIYDPLGIAAPTTVLLKLIFQESWTAVIHWDEPIPEALNARWRALVEDFSSLTKCQVPRYIAAPYQHIQLHGFADASMHAYGAVVYSRVASDGKFHINLVAAKTRVAPIKSVSIPRLELNAALLLTRLLTIVKASLTIPVNNTICWTDPEIMLHWLSAPPRNWNTYVCNRTAEILSDYPRSCWSHVRSEDNPADCASRGLHPSKLLDHELWWNNTNGLCLLASSELIHIWRPEQRNVQPSQQLYIAFLTKVSTSCSSTRFHPGLGS